MEEKKISSTGFKGHSSPSNPPNNTFDHDDLDDYGSVDWSDVNLALAGIGINMLKIHPVARMLGGVRGIRRGAYEVVLRGLDDSLWIVGQFGPKQEAEAMEFFDRLREDPIKWAHEVDEERGTTGMRAPLTYFLAAHQNRQQGVIPGDLVETNEVLDLPVGVGDVRDEDFHVREAKVAAQARLVVTNVWPGVARGVLVGIPASDKRIALEGSQFRVVHRKEHPVRQFPKVWVYEPALDRWKAVAKSVWG